MDNHKIATVLYKLAVELVADLVLSDKDKKVIEAFTDKKALTGNKLSTDGKTLDGSWMGGNKLAHWEGDKIVINDVGSKAGEVVERYLRKNTPKNFLKASDKTAFQGKDALSIYKELRKKGKSEQESAEEAIDAVLSGMGATLSKSSLDKMVEDLIKKAE
jgi:hypothetical protein